MTTSTLKNSSRKAMLGAFGPGDDGHWGAGSLTSQHSNPTGRFLSVWPCSFWGWRSTVLYIAPKKCKPGNVCTLLATRRKDNSCRRKPGHWRYLRQYRKRVFGLVIDFGTSQSPKSTRPLTTYWCPSRPGHQALRNNFASSLLLRTWLPMTGRRVRRPTLFSLWRKARRENSAASRLLGSTSLRFALHGWQRLRAFQDHDQERRHRFAAETP